MEKRAHGFFGRRDMDMTQGGIVSNLLKFAFPLLLGNFFQQLYNMADTWVIGQTGENGAYAAVGSVCILLGAVVGGKIAGKLNAQVMRTVVYAFVGISGVILLLQQL